MAITSVLASAPTCDQALANANALVPPQWCTSLFLPSLPLVSVTPVSIISTTPQYVKSPVHTPNFAAIAIDFATNPNSIYGYAFCGFPACLSSLTWYLSTYPQCTPSTNAASFYRPLSTLLASCPNISASIVNGSNTCGVSDYANYTWAKYQVSLTPNCAADLAGYGSFDTTSLWATVAQAVLTTPSSNLALAFCGSPACTALTQTMQRSLANCSVVSGENLLTSTTALVSFCAPRAAPFSVGGCLPTDNATNTWAKNQVRLTPTCAANLTGYNTSTLWYTTAHATLASPALTTAFCKSVDCIQLTTTIQMNVSNCLGVTGENLFATATTLLNQCAASSSSSCNINTTATNTAWAKTNVTLTPSCAAALTGPYNTTTTWYSAAQAAWTNTSSALTTAFCGSPDCLRLTQLTQTSLSNCALASGENVYANITALVTYCSAHPSPFAVNSCDANVTAANQALLGSVFQKYGDSTIYSTGYVLNGLSNTNLSIFRSLFPPYGVAGLIPTYPSCTPTLATSFYSMWLRVTQGTTNSAIPSDPNCTVSDVAKYAWAKTRRLPPNCAATLAPFGYNTSSSTYAVLQAIAPKNLVPPPAHWPLPDAPPTGSLVDIACRSDDCYNELASLPSFDMTCTVQSGGTSTTQVVVASSSSQFSTVCNQFHLLDVRDRSDTSPTMDKCDGIIALAHDTYGNLSPSCQRDLESVFVNPQTTLPAILWDYMTNPNTLYGYAVCGSANCMAQFKYYLATYPQCQPYYQSIFNSTVAPPNFGDPLTLASAYWGRSEVPFQVTMVPYYKALLQLTSNCDALQASIHGTCQFDDIVKYGWATTKVTLGSSSDDSISCASALAKFGYNTDNNWYNMVNKTNLSGSDAFTAAVCACSHCIQLTQWTGSQLSNCTLNSGENLKLKAQNLVDFCQARQTCDQKIMAANNLLVPSSCQGPWSANSTPTFAAVAADVINNLQSPFAYAFCGLPKCVSSFNWIASAYPTCTPTFAPTYLAPILTLLASCPYVTASIANVNNTCQVGDYANYTWLKTQATLTPNCAADLYGYGPYDTTTLWYTVAQTAVANTAGTMAGAFCGSPFCMEQILAIQTMLSNCTVGLGENLYLSTTALVNYCVVHPLPYQPGSCDALVSTANQQTRYGTLFGLHSDWYGYSVGAMMVALAPGTTTKFSFIESTLKNNVKPVYPTCTPRYATSFASQLASLSLPEYILPIPKTTCLVNDYLDYFGSIGTSLTRNCAAALAPFGYTTASNLYSLIQDTSYPSTLATSFCSSSDCMAQLSLFKHVANSCTIYIDRNIYPAFPKQPINLFQYCTSNFTDLPTCDALVTTANLQPLTPACASNLQLTNPTPTIGSALNNLANMPTPTFGYDICGTPDCLAQFNSLLTTYPQCQPSAVQSFTNMTHATLSQLTLNCPALQAASTGTCTLNDYADYTAARYEVTLSPFCAAALSRYGFTTSSMWYDMLYNATLSTTNNFTSIVCATPDCLQLTLSTADWLKPCTVQSGENLGLMAQNLLSFCAPNVWQIQPMWSNITLPPTTNVPAGNGSTTPPSTPYVTPSASTPPPTTTKSSAARGSLAPLVLLVGLLLV
ncbi:Aste57867_18062 [Aphanomyces stellatus]|uniref:Aste57867_18062 protein n=1 Tax=Aphanomyces stellatus TaxID=120398 RepID=A0A485LAQ0_9STRA|nr:hypothetical protein As57867_018000 [Aphanomyces stellatus]VFT94801.1 Aste57867_18062 [Aphanomyces stellatus]